MKEVQSFDMRGWSEVKLFCSHCMLCLLCSEVFKYFNVTIWRGF